MSEIRRGPAVSLSGHALITARSRELHRAVAEKIRAEPTLLEVVLRNLDRWIDQEGRRSWSK